MKISGGGDESVGVCNGSESGDSATVSERGRSGVQIGISSAIRGQLQAASASCTKREDVEKSDIVEDREVPT